MTATVLYERDGRIVRITLNRPEVLNAIDGDLPGALSDAVARADADPAVHVMVLSGAGRAFCAGYDLTHYASGDTGGGDGEYVGQEMPWDPMDWTPPPDGIESCQGGDGINATRKEKASMDQASIIGIDLAKHSFQVHGARADGSVAFRKKLSRGKVLDFLGFQPPCAVAIPEGARR